MNHAPIFTCLLFNNCSNNLRLIGRLISFFRSFFRCSRRLRGKQDVFFSIEQWGPFPRKETDNVRRGKSGVVGSLFALWGDEHIGAVTLDHGETGGGKGWKDMNRACGSTRWSKVILASIGENETQAVPCR